MNLPHHAPSCEGAFFVPCCQGQGRVGSQARRLRRQRGWWVQVHTLRSLLLILFKNKKCCCMTTTYTETLAVIRKTDFFAFNPGVHRLY